MRRLPALLTSALLTAATAGAAPPAAPAQQPVSNDTSFNYGLSSFLGSGIYSFSGRNVQLYRVPISLRINPDDRAPVPALYLQLPVTFGFYNFKPADVLEGQIPHSLDTVSGLAGLEGRLELTGTWRYLQLLAVGYTHASGIADKRLVGTQMALEHVAPWGSWTLRWRNEFLGALSGGGEGGTDNVLRVLEGLEVDHPQSWRVFGHQAAIGGYFVERWYPSAPAFTVGNAPVRFETEAGLTFGTATPIRVLSLPLPRLSLGYRRAANINVFSLGFGTPF